MTTLNWILFFSFTLLFSCGKKKSPPSFSVRPLEGSSVSSFSPVTSQILAATVDCTAELNYSNAAPQTVSDARSATITSVDYLEHAYAQAMFYDCNARQQALEDSEGELLSSSDIQEILITKEDEDVPFADFTRFVAWEGEPEASENRGRLVNLYLQDDNTRTKTRIDLSKRGGLKTVDTVSNVEWNTGTDHWSRAYFREVSETEQYVMQRHWDSGDNTIIIVAGHFLEGEGSSSFMNTCASTDPNGACPLGNTPVATYLDEDGNTINANQADAAGLINIAVTNNLSTLTDGVNNLERFYTGTLDDFFDPVFE